ncbi:MAG: histidinol phosphatase [Crocinitomicaceae bacterium]|jgi:protein-tyrosine phosphatase|nr:histidinol phosphatase [Crocinitomicaceae bacterium]
MGFLGSIFSKKEAKRDSFDLSVLKVDMHSHLIPGIDDGSKSMDETIGMLTKFENLGFKKVITTPHIMSDYFRNTPEIILGGMEKVQAELKRINLNIEFEAAAEYYYDETLMEKLKNKEKLLTFGDNYLLFEFSFHSEPSQIDNLIFEMITQNYKPVLAHFERYVFLHGSIDKATEWREKGVNIQLNYNSLTGHYGPEVLKQARKLVDSGQIDFVATDCHRIEHLMTLEDNLSGEYFHKLGELSLKNSNL